ncbi:DUF885 family protein [uncultured Sphingomonas sp.]|uniref:DUF885 domain-containing protein n=1 Tax=uncultured Sphingomonas sp. TaxID=158754 RepID=UPI0035CB4BB2
MLIRTIIALALLGAAPPVLAQAPPLPTPLPGDGPEDAKLKRLFYDQDERDLRYNPIGAIYRGDLRYAGSIGDPYTDAAQARALRFTRDDLKAIRAIDRARLTATDQIAYDVFLDGAERDRRGFAPGLVKIGRAMPINHFGGYQTFYPDFASGKGAAPFTTVLDYDNNLKRNAQYAALYDRVIARFREGLRAGIVEPKLTVRNMIEQFDNLLGQGVEGSVFYQPVTMFPPAIPAADRVRLTAAYAAQVRDVIQPAHRKIRDFLADEYLARARDTVGLSAMPGGNAYYAYRIETSTTLPMTAAAVHALGLQEVARDTAQMQAQAARIGWTGTLPQLFDRMRTDPRFQPTSATDVRAGYAAIARAVDAHVDEQFALRPKAPLELRPVPAFREKTAASGSYEEGTPDGSRPGIFYYDTYDLPSRYTWGMDSLYLHEAIPGHHFQISLAQENAKLPAFMRFGGNTAYVEGWALYAESLYAAFGQERDPYDRMGGLNDDMLRAMRLVVDSGLHAMGWSREQAIAYILANSPESRTDATAEVERYIANPGQALAYKIGQLTILKLKAEAQAALGATFDPRAFHAVVLDTGALPMLVLEKKVRAWIAAGGGMPAA